MTRFVKQMIPLLLALFTSLEPSDSSAQPPETISLGAIFGLTGDSAPFGKGELDAATLAVEEWNSRGGVRGKRVELKVEDSGTSQIKVLSAFRKLTEIDGRRIIVGPTWLDTFQAVVPVAERSKVLLVTPSAEGRALHHSVPGDPWALTAYYSTEIEVRSLLRALAKSGITRIIGTYTEEPFFLLTRTLVEEEAPKSGITNIASYNFPMSFTDFRSMLPKLLEQKPDAILLFQTAEAGIRNFLRSRSEQGSGVAIAGIHDFEGFLKDPEIMRLSEGLYYPRFDLADAGFADRFKKRFGYDAILTHSNAYDVVNMILSAMQADNSTAETVRKYLLSRPIQTVTFGSTRFSKDGVIQGTKVRVFQIRNQRPVPVP